MKSPLSLGILFKRSFFWKRTQPNFGKYSQVEPRTVSPTYKMPPNIPPPSYYATGQPTESIPDHPEIKNAEQIQKMKDSCKLAANILKTVGTFIEVGRTTDEVDRKVLELCIENKAYPSPLNYRGFPKSVCTSVNNVACHGVPDDRPLENGDIINVDVTVFYNGYHGDCSKTFLVGNVDKEGQILVATTEFCLNKAIEICKPGLHFREIGSFIQNNARTAGFNVVPAFIGHGIGHYFHGPPDIYHTRNNYPGRMYPGMTFTIEPVLTQGDQTVEILEDTWTAVTIDGARTAQFEHTVLITENGVEVLTVPD